MDPGRLGSAAGCSYLAAMIEEERPGWTAQVHTLEVASQLAQAGKFGLSTKSGSEKRNKRI